MAGNISFAVNDEGLAHGFDTDSEILLLHLQSWEEIVGEVVNLFVHDGLHHIILNIGTIEFIVIQLTEMPIGVTNGDMIGVLRLDSGREVVRVIEQVGGKQNDTTGTD